MNASKSMPPRITTGAEHTRGTTETPAPSSAPRRARRRRPAPLILIALAVGASVLLSACGRVNLEDLTPEAERTAQAMITPTPERPTPAPGETPGTDSGSGGGGDVDLLAGRSLYGNFCSGCHDNQRAGAQALLGRAGVDPDATIEMLRSGTLAAGGPHNDYPETQLSDQQIRDIVAHISQ